LATVDYYGVSTMGFDAVMDCLGMPLTPFSDLGAHGARPYCIGARAPGE
jgi:hypothetical protein